VLSRRDFLGYGSALAAFASVKINPLFANGLPGAFSKGYGSPLPSQAQEPDSALLDRARALLKEAPLIDTHNDLPTMLLELHGDLSRYDLGEVQPTLCADIPRLREGRVGGQ